MKDLTKKENWTEELIYVHRTRLISGFLHGIIFTYFIMKLLNLNN